MIRGKGLIIVAGCLLSLLGLALACRFNVRDVGFVDLGSQQYSFYCLVHASAPPETNTTVKEIASAAFFNTNVEPLVLDQSDPRAEPWRNHKPPLGILLSPDGERTLTLPLINDGEDLQETLWTNMEAVFESPARSAILTKAIDTYGVIVFVEGPDAQENARIRDIARSVIARIEQSLGNLEKEIQKPPVLHVISSDKAASEKVLLWSLGLDGGPPKAPVISVIYARGRQIGQMLKGADIEKDTLFNIMRTIGLNCECGLDRSWMQGRMMPLKWDSETQSRVAHQLGFDAEDPLIKMEMSQILSKGERARKTKTSAGAPPSSLDHFLEDYEERQTASSSPPASGMTVEEPGPGGTSDTIRHGLYLTVGLLAGGVIMAGLIILIRARSQNG